MEAVLFEVEAEVRYLITERRVRGGGCGEAEHESGEGTTELVRDATVDGKEAVVIVLARGITELKYWSPSIAYLPRQWHLLRPLLGQSAPTQCPIFFNPTILTSRLWQWCYQNIWEPIDF